MKIDLEEIKNEVAVSYGYNDWKDLLKMHVRLNHVVTSAEYSIEALSNYENEAMQEYAKQCCDEQIHMCAENANAFIGIYDEPLVAKCSILSTPNVVTTNTK